MLSFHIYYYQAADPRLRRERERVAAEKRFKEEEKKKAEEERIEKERIERVRMEKEMAKKKAEEGMAHNLLVIACFFLFYVWFCFIYYSWISRYVSHNRIQEEGCKSKLKISLYSLSFAQGY